MAGAGGAEAVGEAVAAEEVAAEGVAVEGVGAGRAVLTGALRDDGVVGMSTVGVPVRDASTPGATLVTPWVLVPATMSRCASPRTACVVVWSAEDGAGDMLSGVHAMSVGANRAAVSTLVLRTGRRPERPLRD